jgi:hypothetical protein
VNKEYFQLLSWSTDFKAKYEYVPGASQVISHVDSAIELFEKVIGKPKSATESIAAVSPVGTVALATEEVNQPLVPKYTVKLWDDNEVLAEITAAEAPAAVAPPVMEPTGTSPVFAFS